MPEDLTAFARSALAEDAPAGDLTTELTVDATVSCTAELIAKRAGVVAGTQIVSVIFDVAASQDGTSVVIEIETPDGSIVQPGDRVAVVRGAAVTILRAERPAMNLLGHLSGVATATRRFVEAATPADVLCTRKTTPGLRALERAAVLAGGGSLHRASLSDAVLIKDNHVRIAGGVAEAVHRAHAGDAPVEVEVEVEVETLEQLEEALGAGAERILLDNASAELVRLAVDRLGGPDRLEVSGGVTLDNIASFARAGARSVSVGAITHSAPALDMSLEVLDVHG